MSSTERQALFYPIFPVLGKRLSFQWGNIRQDWTEAGPLVRSTVLDVEDGVDLLNAKKAVMGRELGEQTQQRRWRTYYDSDENKFKLQRNTNTQEVPIWVDCIELEDGDGDLTHTGDSATFTGIIYALGGVFADPGFYGFGRAQVFGGQTGIEWQVNHGFNNSPVMTTVFNNDDKVISPSNISIDVSDPNTAYFYFAEATNGKVLISTGVSGGLNVIPSIRVTDGDNVYTTEVINVNQDHFYLSGDDDGNPVINIEGLPDGVVLRTEGDAVWKAKSDYAGNIDEIQLEGSGANFTRFKQILGDTEEVTILPQAGGTVLKRWENVNAVDFNFDNKDIDLIVEGVTDQNLVRIDAGTDRVGIGIPAPTEKLDVDGNLRVRGSIRATGKASKIVADGFYLNVGGDLISNASTVAGFGYSVFNDKQGNILRFRRLFPSAPITMSETAGVITIGSTGGGGGEGGFYGVYFKESEAGGYEERDDTLVVDSDYFYLSSDGSGKPILGLLGIPDGVILRTGTAVATVQDHVQETDAAITTTVDRIIRRGSGTTGTIFIDEAEANTATLNIDTQIIPALNRVNIDMSSAGMLSVNENALDIDVRVEGAGDANLIYTNAGTNRVGIGLAAPTEKLDINGNLRVRGSIRATGKASKVVADGFYKADSGELVTTVTSAGGTSLIGTRTDDDVLIKGLVAGPGVILTPSATGVTIDTSGTGVGGGFYGVYFRESEAGGYSERDDTLVVDSDYFYLSSDGSGKPILSSVGGSGGVTAHSALTGLVAPADDHTQYILEDGTRAFSANQSMGGFKLTSLGAPTLDNDAARLIDVVNSGGGFYGVIFRETGTGDGYRNDVFAVDNEWFYLSASGGDGKPIISSTGKAKYIPSATGNRSIWNIGSVSAGSNDVAIIRQQQTNISTIGDNIMAFDANSKADSNKYRFINRITNARIDLTVEDTVDFLTTNATALGFTNLAGTTNFTNSGDTVFRTTGGNIDLQSDVGEVVVNDDGNVNAGFRVEGPGNTHLLFVQGTAPGRVGIKTSTPTATLEVVGNIRSSGKASQIIADGFYGGDGHFDNLTSSEVTTIRAINTEVTLNGNTKDLTMDWSTSNAFFLPIRRPMTIHTPTNLPTDTQVVQLATKNDGFYSFVWSSKYIFPGGGQIKPTEGAGKVDLWSMMYVPALDRIMVTKAADLFY